MQEDRSRAPARLLPHLAAARLDECVVTRTLREPVPVGVGGAREVYDARMRGVHVVETEAEPFHHTGPERLHDHVGGSEQPLEHVDRERSPAPVPHAVAVIRTEGVAAGWFDLDRVSALLREQEHTERTGDTPRQIEDADTVECARHHYGSLAAARHPARLRCVRTARHAT